MLDKNFFISENEFRVWNPNVSFIAKSEGEGEEEYNSRKIKGIMTTPTYDRQGESLFSKGLDFNPFLENGHFNDNHSQATGAIVGYPEAVNYSKDIIVKGKKREGWICDGYVLKGTKRSDEIWELAKALQNTPNRRLGFSVEGKVVEREGNVIKKAFIKNVAITNCPVNTEATWDVLTKSFIDEDIAMKSLSAGHATSPAAQSGGAALIGESLEKDDEESRKKKQNTLKYISFIQKSLGIPSEEEFFKAIAWVQDYNPEFTVDAAQELVGYIIKSKVRKAL